MELFFFRFLFPFWKDGLSCEAQAGSVCSGKADFSEQHISEKGKKLHLTAVARLGGDRGGGWRRKGEKQMNKNP